MADDRKHILVIEDDEDIREYLCHVLRTDGFDVVSLADGQGVENCLEQNHVDLVVTDLVMPDKEGIETIGGLRRQHPHLRIIAISGAMNSDLYLETARRIGADKTFQKPVPRETILRSVRELLG